MTTSDALDRFSRLLPYYVNGTLEEAQRQQVDGALAFSPELRALLAEEERLASAIRDDTEDRLQAGEGAEGGAMSQMMAGLPGQEPVTPASSANTGGLEGALAFLSPQRWNPTVLLGAGALGLAGFSGWQATLINDLERENYELLEGRQAASPAPDILAEFAGEAEWSAIQALLEQEGLAIVSSGGFGLFGLQSGADGETLAAQLERLRASPLVLTADPAA